MNKIAIELCNVCFSYDGEHKILENVNISLDYGRVHLFSGHSGEGKSTLMYIVSGIIPNVTDGVLSGKVLINGEDIKGKRLGEICRKVGVVLQNADEQIIQKTVGDEIAFGCENLAFLPEKIEKQIETVCRLMKLNPSWECRKLSGGQKQRLIAASTLAMGQKIVILDEPLANLDSAGAQMLMAALKTLANSGYCVIVIEHRLDAVLPFADTVWNVCAGRAEKVENKAEYLRSQTVAISDASKPHGQGAPLFELNRVCFRVGRREILKEVSFTVNEGERLLLLGENGCGKTTLTRLIARLCKPASGEIVQHLDPKFGKNKRGGKWFKNVGVVYQNPNYQLFMPTVEKEIAFSAASEEYADEIIALFGLERLRKRHPHSLSEGQKRRVSIAAVAAGNPRVLILDEPTVGQDYKGLCELVKIFNELHDKNGNTMITVTHDMRCAEALCDRAVLIADGAVKEQGGKALARGYFFRD